MLRVGAMAIFALTIVALNYREVFRSKSRGAQQVRGSIELIDVSSRVLVVRTHDSAHSHSFTWDEKTGFFNIDGAITPQATAPGQRVSVVYATHRGQEVASRIEVEPVYEAEPAGLAKPNSLSLKTEPRQNG